MAAAEYARNFPKPSAFIAYQIDAMMEQQNAGTFLKYPARNWTFDGILDGLMEVVGAGDIDFLPITIPFDKFGWFYPRNDSADYDGTFGMWTGASDIMKVGQISEWNYMQHVKEDIYPETCGELTGSAGEFFPPGRGKDSVDFFTPDLCRSIRFEYSEEVSIDG